MARHVRVNVEVQTICDACGHDESDVRSLDERALEELLIELTDIAASLPPRLTEFRIWLAGS